LLCVTVKLTKVVLLHTSGGNDAEGSLVERNSLNEGEKSISCLPSCIRTRPPVFWYSLLRTWLRIGSRCSASWMRIGFPNRRALSNCLTKESSKKLVTVSFLSVFSFCKNSVTRPEGSMMRGYLLYRFRTMAFSVQRSSTGSECSCQVRRSSAFDRYSVIGLCGLKL